MQKQASKIIVIMGPTASGKSGVAIKLAQKFDGEIISADSRQIFKNMNIGTGKVIKQLTTDNSPASTRGDNRLSTRGGQLTTNSDNAYFSEGIVHHLIDVAEPMEDFNISHFKASAEKAIGEILSRGRLPIICGGTAFWIDAVVKNIVIPEVAPNEKLRAELEKKSAEDLFLELQKLDPRRAENIDSKNKVRLIRAIEICHAIGKVPEPSKVKGQRSKVKHEFLQIGIKTDKEKLHEKIQKRLDERFDEPASTRGDNHSSTRGGGMIKEVENLHESGVTWEWMERIGLEYRWISRFLQGKVNETEMKEKLYFDIIHYAKRQMTWLKKNKELIWLEDYHDIEKEVAKFLQ